LFGRSYEILLNVTFRTKIIFARQLLV